MTERPDPIKRLDALFSAAMIAHEAIFEMRRELIAYDRGNPEQAGLLEESAQIVTGKLPGLTARARQLSGKWTEQSLLDRRSRPAKPARAWSLTLSFRRALRRYAFSATHTVTVTSPVGSRTHLLRLAARFGLACPSGSATYHVDQ